MYLYIGGDESADSYFCVKSTVTDLYICTWWIGQWCHPFNTICVLVTRPWQFYSLSGQLIEPMWSLLSHQLVGFYCEYDPFVNLSSLQIRITFCMSCMCNHPYDILHLTRTLWPQQCSLHCFKCLFPKEKHTYCVSNITEGFCDLTQW